MADHRPNSVAPKKGCVYGPLLRNTIGLIVALAFLGWICLSPESASRLGRELHNGILLPLSFCALATAALQMRGFQFRAWSIAFVVAFLLLQLWWLWFAGVSDTMLVGGFLPFSDAADYLVNAQVLASGERIQGQGHGNDHLLASAMLAVLWRATQGDYRLILVVLNLLGAAAAWIAMAEVTLFLGTAVGAVWLFADLLFLRRFIGVPLTEHLGMILGNLGLAFGCRAVRLDRGGYWLLAAFSFQLALCARPGALLTMPALVAGAFFAWPKKKSPRWLVPCAMALSMFLAFMLDKLVTNAVGNQRPEAVLSNVVYHLHSLVYGGTWTDAMNLYGNDRTAVWHAVETQIREHPSSLFLGSERSLLAFLHQGYLFCYVNNRWLNLALHLAFATGCIAVVRALRREKRAWWLFAILSGLFASLPMLPPWNTDNMRVYAATIPLIVFTATVGIYAGSTPIRSWAVAVSAHQARYVNSLFSEAKIDVIPTLGFLSQALLAAVMVLCVFLPPLFSPRVLPSRTSLEDTYRLNKVDGTITYLPDMALRLVSDSSPHGALNLRLVDFRAGLAGFSRFYQGEARLLASLPAGCELLPSSHEFSFIAIDERHVPNTRHDQAINLRFRFIADGWLLLAVDEALVARSTALAAFDSNAIGAFSFGIDRFPVIRTGDTITLVENVNSVGFFSPPRYGAGINSIKPFVIGSRRLHFPVPGEYYLRVNEHFSLKLLVLERDSKKADSDRLIRNFVTSNCIVDADEGVRSAGREARFDPMRFFETETPVLLTRKAMLEGIAELEACLEQSTSQ